jgi:hypothetical protein
MPTGARRVLAALVLLAAALAFAACGGDDNNTSKRKVDDPNPDNDAFHVAAEASGFGGPTPLAVKFYATPFHEKGPVHYRWRFDDGTTSEEQEPTHTFSRPGYYQVLLEARDAKATDAWNLIVGAWPPDVWESRSKAKGPITKTTIRKLQKAQGLRTAARRKEQVAKSKQRAKQYSTPAT